MGWDAVVARFVERSPLTVMAHLTLRRAVAAEWLDALFAQHAERQYVRALLFSTVVDLLASVTFGFRPSLHAAGKARRGRLPVSLTALYDKLNRTEPVVVQAVVAEGAQRLAAVLTALTPWARPAAHGYRVRIVDGNHLPATEKRLKALRGVRGAALPGHSLVVYDPQLGLAVDLVPCEDAHRQERALMTALLPRVEPEQLWIADRNFSTTAILAGFAGRGAGFIVRKHQRSPTVTPAGPVRGAGRTPTGRVDEQPVTILDPAGPGLALRQIRVHLIRPTRDGARELVLLTNVPAARLAARAIAELYRERWTIEGMFGELEAALASEVRTLGHPRAALLAFGLAVLAYNVLQVVRRAVETTHTHRGAVPAVSAYHVAVEIRATYHGFAIATEASDWTAWDGLSVARFAEGLRQLAAAIDLATVATSRRGPKKPVPKGYVARSIAQRHHATARLMTAAKPPKKTP
jgi:IS4 transposase